MPRIAWNFQGYAALILERSRILLLNGILKPCRALPVKKLIISAQILKGKSTIPGDNY